MIRAMGKLTGAKGRESGEALIAGVEREPQSLSVDAAPEGMVLILAFAPVLLSPGF